MASLTVVFLRHTVTHISITSQSGPISLILLVEGDLGMRTALRQILLFSGHQVLLAEGGAGARRLWQQNIQQIDLLYTDMALPGDLSGLDLVEQMQAEKPGLPAIISSGYSPESVGLDKPTKAVFTFLRKPVTIEDIKKNVSQLLAQA